MTREQAVIEAARALLDSEPAWSDYARDVLRSALASLDADPPRKWGIYSILTNRAGEWQLEVVCPNKSAAIQAHIRLVKSLPLHMFEIREMS